MNTIKRLFIEPALLQKVEEVAQNHIDVTEFRLVSRAREACAHGRRKIIRCVQIEQVKERQRRAEAACFSIHLERRIDYIFSQSLQIGGVGFTVDRRAEWTVVNVESLIQSELTVEHKAADKRPCPVASCAKHLGQGRSPCRSAFVRCREFR